MSSQAYTNKCRILAEVANTKVQYPARMLSGNGLISTANCNPNFNTLTYTKICTKCIFPKIPIIGYSGDRSTTNSSNILDGGNSGTNSSNVLSGGSS